MQLSQIQRKSKNINQNYGKLIIIKIKYHEINQKLCKSINIKETYHLLETIKAM